MVPEFIALSVALIACLAEILHQRRINRVRLLAFGPAGRPRHWTWTVPVWRVVGLTLAAWGFASLWLQVEPRVHNQELVKENEYKHLVLVVDVSPSMHLQDAGPEGDRSRRQRASDVIESLFNRVPTRNFKISLIGVYTDAKALLEDSKDHEVVRHIMERMPMWHAYKPGKTNLLSGISLASKMARPWNPGSTFVVVLTDGDTVPPTGMPKLPASVAEFIVVGLGNPNNGTFIDGHQSRQDVNTLRQVANRLRGVYHNGNQKHLTSQIVGRFVNSRLDDSSRAWTRREWSLAAAAAGSALFALLPLWLHYFGTAFHGGVSLTTDWKRAA